jgi:hypothetical protein
MMARARWKRQATSPVFRSLGLEVTANGRESTRICFTTKGHPPLLKLWRDKLKRTKITREIS